MNIDYNINEKINEEFNKNRIEIMEMGKITIINDPCDIKEELDFINEDILIKLGFKKEDLNDKELNMIKIDNNIFQIIFKDNHRINIINKEDKQEILIIERASLPNDQNMENESNLDSIDNNIGDNNIEDILKSFYKGICNMFNHQKKNFKFN